MSDTLTVFIVDDDPAIRDSLTLLLGIHDYRVSVFDSAESFLQACKTEWKGCLLLDIRMPGMDGLSLQKILMEQGIQLSVIIITGHGDLSSAREAFRTRAVDFLEKPVDHKKLLAAIDDAFSIQTERKNREKACGMFHQKISNLTPREQEVMNLVVAGRHNREIASQLGISPRTVEVHKARMMDKLNVSSIAELVRMHLAPN